MKLWSSVRVFIVSPKSNGVFLNYWQICCELLALSFLIRGVRHVVKRAGAERVIADAISSNCSALLLVDFFVVLNWNLDYWPASSWTRKHLHCLFCFFSVRFLNRIHLQMSRPGPLMNFCKWAISTILRVLFEVDCIVIAFLTDLRLSLSGYKCFKGSFVEP